MLKKLIGKRASFYVMRHAGDIDSRREAEEKYRDIIARWEELGAAMHARSTAILQADAEYQQIVRDLRAVRKEKDLVGSATRSYRFTAGSDEGICFHILAQGDTWEDVKGILEWNREHPDKPVTTIETLIQRREQEPVA